MADIQQNLVLRALHLVESFLKASNNIESLQDLQEPLNIFKDYFNKFAGKPKRELTDSQKQQLEIMCAKLEKLENVNRRRVYFHHVRAFHWKTQEIGQFSVYYWRWLTYRGEPFSIPVVPVSSCDDHTNYRHIFNLAAR